MPAAMQTKISYEEFLEWTGEDQHVERVEGEVVPMSPISDRAMLLLPLGVCLAFGFLSWAAGQGLAPGMGIAGGAAVCDGAGLLLLGGLYVYRTCGLHVDVDGLTRITPLRRRLAWGQVEGRNERLRFSRGIVGYEELKEEIARRATECGGKAWERRATTPSPDDHRRGRRGPRSSARG